MASIVSLLDEDKEKRLQSFFPRPVRLHLLYQSSHHGSSISSILSRSDRSGSFVLIVFLESGLVRGGFTTNSLKAGKQFNDGEAFVFDIGWSSRCLASNSVRSVEVHFPDSGQPDPFLSGLGFSHAQNRSGFTFGGPVVVNNKEIKSDPIAVSFGRCLHLYSEGETMSVNFCTDNIYNTGWREEKGLRCVDVELHRVQELEDVLPEPWRELSWTEETRNDLREKFLSYKLVVETLPQVRALLLGPVGSGKSSLINSIRSTMYRRIIHLPNVGTATGSFTKKLKTYDIRVERGGPSTALSLCDVMAVGDEDFAGLSLSDAVAIIKGHVPEGYQFQSDFPITDKVRGYKATPTLTDKVHCVLFVLDASKVTSYSSSLRANIRKLQTTVSDLDVPHLVLLTNVDQVCEAVKKDGKHVYSSRAVQEKMQKAAELVGLPLSYVLPVKNYISQLSVDCNTDILLLNAVSNILQAVDDTLEDQFSTVRAESLPQNPVNNNIGVAEI